MNAFWGPIATTSERLSRTPAAKALTVAGLMAFTAPDPRPPDAIYEANVSVASLATLNSSHGSRSRSAPGSGGRGGRGHLRGRRALAPRHPVGDQPADQGARDRGRTRAPDPVKARSADGLRGGRVARRPPDRGHHGGGGP